MITLIWMLVAGVIIGSLARWIMPGDDSMNLLQTCLLGIAGSVVGGFIGEGIAYLFGIYFPAILTAICGGVLILWLMRNRPWEKWLN